MPHIEGHKKNKVPELLDSWGLKINKVFDKDYMLDNLPDDVYSHNQGDACLGNGC